MSRRDEIIDLLHRYRRSELLLAEDVADAILKLFAPIQRKRPPFVFTDDD